MSAHRAHRAHPAHRVHRERRTRSPVVLALLVGLLVGAVAAGGGTLASWNDRATIGTGTVVAGTLDLRVDGSGASGQGTAYTKTALGFADRAPGEHEAYPLSLHNVGNPPGTYTLTVARGSTWTYGNDAIRVQAFTGAVVEDTDYPITDSCTGSSLGPSVLLADAADHTLVTTPRRLTAGGSETICLRVGIDPDAGNGNQGASGTLRLVATLTQATS